MGLSTNFLLAKRYLFSKKKEKFLSVTIRFACIGMIIGVATLIIVTSVMNGFQHEIVDKLSGINGHIVIKSDEGVNRDRLNELIKKLHTISNITKINPVLQQNALFANKNRFDGVMTISFLNDNAFKIISGSKIKDSVGIGTFFAAKNNVKIGDKLTIISPKTIDSVVGELPVSKTFIVGYIFESGMYQYDSQMIVLPFEMSKKLFFLDGVTDIRIFIKNPMLVDNIKNEIYKFLSNDEFLFDWRGYNTNLLNAVKVEKNVMFLILMLIILVAGFNIITSMVMLVKDKVKDIAILKTVGFSNFSIMKIFFYCGSMIGLFGTFIGGVFGLLFSYYIDDIKSLLEKLLDMNLFPAEIYYLLELPSKVEISEVVLIIVATLVVAFLSSIFPAIKAAKMKPLDILRYE